VGKKGYDLDLAAWANLDDKDAWRRANALFRSELEAFARHRKDGKGGASPGTAAARISMIRSFYEFCVDGFFPDYPNPCRKVKRPHVDINGKVAALEPKMISDGMDRIDRKTLQGMRDYALLAVFLETGRRLSEVASLLWGDCQLVGSLDDLKSASDIKLVLNFRRIKGGKTARHVLSFAASVAILESMARIYEINPLSLNPGRPLWPNLTRWASSKKFTALSLNGVRGVVYHTMGTSRVHQLRHTFAQQCLAAGLTLPDIALLMGHANLATLSAYLEALSPERGVNPALERLGRVFHIQ
jgi:integrase/recombinase XerD